MFLELGLQTNNLSLQDFTTVVDNTVVELKDHFRDGLEEKCQAGATNAAAAAIQVSDEFAGSMHWASYRASGFLIDGVSM